MARIRSVHPGLFTDESFVSCSPMARLLVIGIWTEADDQGIFEWKPITLKMRVLPADNADIVPLLDELIDQDMVKMFEIDGKKYGAIRNFRKYQRPKSPNSVHPIPDELRKYVGLPPIISETGEDKRGQFPQKGEIFPQMEDGGGRMEEEGEKMKEERESKPRKSSASPLPPDFMILDSVKEEFEALHPDVDVPKEIANWRDHRIAEGSTRVDWLADLRKWIRNSKPADPSRKPCGKELAACGKPFDNWTEDEKMQCARDVDVLGEDGARGRYKYTRAQLAALAAERRLVGEVA